MGRRTQAEFLDGPKSAVQRLVTDGGDEDSLDAGVEQNGSREFAASCAQVDQNRTCTEPVGELGERLGQMVDRSIRSQ